MASSPSARATFSTRFLSSDGIPAYNALLDSHLGKRREFLLGNPESLQLLAQTGAIARVESKRENPSQYVVVVSEDKPAPSAHSRRRGRAPPPPHSGRDARHPRDRGVDGVMRRNESSPHVAARLSTSASSGTLTRPSSRDARHEDSSGEFDSEDEKEMAASSADTSRDRAAPSASAAEQRTSGARLSLKSMGRSASTTALYGRTFSVSDSNGSSNNSSSGSIAVDASDSNMAARGSVSLTAAGTVRTAVEPSPSSLIDRLRRRRASQGEVTDLIKKRDSFADIVATRSTTADRNSSVSKPAAFVSAQAPVASQSTPAKPERSTVERLLESDAAYQLKLQTLQDEARALDQEKALVDAHIATLRKRLRGVNAVHENDVAVAHCSSIMHARIVKAEEEFMKLVTAQQQVKTDIDTVRRELLAMRKVQRKLEDDIADVRVANAAMDERIRAAKGVRNVVSEELVELERRAEVEAEEQRLKLPPEEDVIVDADELMGAVQRRNASRAARRRSSVHQADANAVAGGTGSPLGSMQRKATDRALLAADGGGPAKPLLSLCSAFRVIQQTLACGDLDAFVEQFEETEDVLLSKYRANSQLQEEVDELERDAARLARAAVARIDSYNDLREVRNHEQTRLRAIMQRCLEILHAEKLVSRQESLGGPMLLSELSSPAMLEALQKKMTEVAITLKLKHNAKMADAAAENSQQHKADGSGGRHSSSYGGTKAGKNTRRSNLFMKREVASKIVLGPREPSGSALTSILMTAQPPTVEGAQVLSETHADGMRQLHPSIIPAGNETQVKPVRKLTLSRVASIRSGKRVSTLVSSNSSGSLRRISAPPTSTSSSALASAAASPSAAASGPSSASPPRQARVSMVWPLQHRPSKSMEGGSTDSIIQAEDAFAHVVDDTDELDS